MGTDSFVDPVIGKVWRKVLFERGDFPDNFTPDECFLAAIKRNQNLHKYTLGQCFLGASQVALQMTVVLVFAMAYISLDDGVSTHSDIILGLVATSSVVGYLGLHVYNRTGLPFALYLEDLQHVSIFLLFSFSLSPVLYKLTDTISTDTIHTTSGVMLFVHLVFHNYGLERAAVVSNALSLNAALFASVSLASRLASSYDAFVLLSFSVVAFVLFPIFRLKLQGRLLRVAAFIGMVMSVGLTARLYTAASSVLATIAFVFVMAISPKLFVHWQNHKDTIHGPWDEAVPNITL